MLNLSSNQKLYASSSAGNIPYSISGRYDYAESGSAGVMKQGYIKPAFVQVFTPTQNFILSSLHVHNILGVPTNLQFSINAADSSGMIFKASLGAGFSLTLDVEGWKVYDASGMQKLSFPTVGTLADGDYGDITISGSGTVMTVDAGSHTHPASEVGSGNISDTEFEYLNGASSNIQTQIDNIELDIIALAIAL